MSEHAASSRHCDFFSRLIFGVPQQLVEYCEAATRTETRAASRPQATFKGDQALILGIRCRSPFKLSWKELNLMKIRIRS